MSVDQKPPLFTRAAEIELTHQQRCYKKIQAGYAHPQGVGATRGTLGVIRGQPLLTLSSLSLQRSSVVTPDGRSASPHTP